MGDCEKVQRYSKGRISNESRGVGAHLCRHGALEGGIHSLAWPHVPDGAHCKVRARAEITCRVQGVERLGASVSGRDPISGQRGSEGEEVLGPVVEGDGEENWRSVFKMGQVDGVGGKAQGRDDDPAQDVQFYEPHRLVVGGGCRACVGGEDARKVERWRVVVGRLRQQNVEGDEHQRPLHQ